MIDRDRQLIVEAFASSKLGDLLAVVNRMVDDANAMVLALDAQLSHYQGWNGDCRCCEDDCPI